MSNSKPYYVVKSGILLIGNRTFIEYAEGVLGSEVVTYLRRDLGLEYDLEPFFRLNSVVMAFAVAQWFQKMFDDPNFGRRNHLVQDDIRFYVELMSKDNGKHYETILEFFNQGLGAEKAVNMSSEFQKAVKASRAFWSDITNIWYIQDLLEQFHNDGVEGIEVTS